MSKRYEIVIKFNNADIYKLASSRNLPMLVKELNFNQTKRLVFSLSLYDKEQENAFLE